MPKNNKCNLTLTPNRVKEVYRLEEMEKIFVRYELSTLESPSIEYHVMFHITVQISVLFFRLEMKVTKSSGGVPRLSYTGRDDRHFLPTGLYIIKTVNGGFKCVRWHLKELRTKSFTLEQTGTSTSSAAWDQTIQVVFYTSN